MCTLFYLLKLYSFLFSFDLGWVWGFRHFAYSKCSSIFWCLLRDLAFYVFLGFGFIAVLKLCLLSFTPIFVFCCNWVRSSLHFALGYSQLRTFLHLNISCSLLYSCWLLEKVILMECFMVQLREQLSVWRLHGRKFLGESGVFSSAVCCSHGVTLYLLRFFVYQDCSFLGQTDFFIRVLHIFWRTRRIRFVGCLLPVCSLYPITRRKVNNPSFHPCPNNPPKKKKPQKILVLMYWKDGM